LVQVILWAAAAVTAFSLAYIFSSLSYLILVYLFALLQMTRAKTARQAFYGGFGTGFACAATQLHCFWTIFGPGAIALWCVLGFWVGLFVALARACRMRLGPQASLLLAPFLWTGLEYFRSELYYLRFSWLNAGYVFSDVTFAAPVFKLLGMYGIGFAAMSACAVISLLPAKRAMMLSFRLALLGVVALFFHAWAGGSRPALKQPAGIPVAGAQLEFAGMPDVIQALEDLVQLRPEAQLLVLSEYTLNGPPPDRLLNWCRENRKWLVVGGRNPVDGKDYYNTAFVIGPDGRVAFQQGKSVPIQFMKDGLPAPAQTLWNSPWGKIGICICYDLSYTRVTDALVRLGAEAIIVPTMDVADWGAYHHRLHARVAPVRAAEYGIPIFRVASSGISQLLDAEGQVIASAPFPGAGAMLGGDLGLGARGRLPLDRWLAPAASVIVLATILALLVMSRRAKQASSANGARPSAGAARDTERRTHELAGAPARTGVAAPADGRAPGTQRNPEPKTSTDS
jgi:apolipoprotein N-acyltransferase